MVMFGKRWLLPAVAVMVGAGAFVATHRAGAQPAARYVTAPVTRGDVTSFVSATGLVQPWKVVDVKSDIGGRIDKMAVDLGDRVKAGQLIALIDPTDARATAEQADADLSASIAKRDQAAADAAWQSSSTRAKVEAAKRAVQAARAKQAQAAANMRAQPKLTDAAVAQAQAALAAAEKAQTQAQLNKQQLESELTQLRNVTLPQDLETARNDLNQAQANVKTATADYKRQRDLYGQGYVARSDMESSYAKLATLQASEKNAQQRSKTIEENNRLQQEQMQQRIAQAQAQIDAAAEQVRQTKAALDAARENGVQDDLRRQDYVAAQAEVQQSQAELQAAVADYQQITVKQKDIEAARAQIVKNEAALRQARTNLGYTRVLAPRDGVVIAKNVEEGTVVPSSRQAFGSTNALVQIGDVSRLWIVCDVDETDIARVREGQDASVTLDAYPDEPQAGRVIRIDPQSVIQQNVTMIPVTVELAHPDARFKPGMNATCRFISGEAKNVLQVPNEAIKTARRGGSTVRLLVKGQPQAVPVETGLAGQETTEIRSGLKEGDQVVTRVIEPRKPAATNSNPLAGGIGGPGGRGGGRGGR